jgi:D-sedoheptulose 7-phosphate isomerase
MDNHKFLKTYFHSLPKLLFSQKDIILLLVQIKNILLSIKKKNKKIIIIGNGGSASIASHFSVDITKNAKIRCINFNESSLITAFANDYGFENSFSNAINFYGDKGDVLIAISSSGKSKNIINACKIAKKKNFYKIISLSGFPETSVIKKFSNINLMVDSKSYNFIENIHQIWLLAVVDLIIGKTEYKVN